MNTDDTDNPDREDAEAQTPPEHLTSKNPLPFMVRIMLAIEKLRVSTQIRDSHLGRLGRKDQLSLDVLEDLRAFEARMDKRNAALLRTHPAYHWFGRIKGVGLENIAKVVGFVDIEKARSISGLWSFAGYAVVTGENGKSQSPRRVKGAGKLPYNSRLRTMCWRLGSSLMKARGKYFDFYENAKAKLYERYAKASIKVVPSDKLPKKGGKKYEPDDQISEGHVHMQALRKMIKLFLSHLWLVWREAEGLPISQPYAHAQMGHTDFIGPWEMVEKPEPKLKRTRAVPPDTTGLEDSEADE